MTITPKFRVQYNRKGKSKFNLIEVVRARLQH